jgi:hypothetical protein
MSRRQQKSQRRCTHNALTMVINYRIVLDLLQAVDRPGSFSGIIISPLNLGPAGILISFAIYLKKQPIVF